MPQAMIAAARDSKALAQPQVQRKPIPRQSFVQDYVVHGLFVLDFSCTWRNKILAKILDFSRYTC